MATDSDKTNTLRKGLLFLIVILSLVLMYYFYQQSALDRVKEKIYGEWIEVGAPPYDTERMVISERGVMIGSRHIATSFSFSGKKLVVRTGSGERVYILSGTHDNPQLKRVSRGRSIQIFAQK